MKSKCAAVVKHIKVLVLKAISHVRVLFKSSAVPLFGDFPAVSALETCICSGALKNN